MASQPPAGYNPDASLLQGGTASITPVQGGGSMATTDQRGGSISMAAGTLPSTYNPQETLLTTPATTAVHIMAVKGGGDEEAYAEYVMEQYMPPLESIVVPNLPPAPTLWSMNALYESSMPSRLKELKTFLTDPATSSSNLQDYTYGICPTKKLQRSKLSDNFFQASRKRYVIHDVENPLIYIIPNLRGSLSIFLQYTQFLLKGSKTLPDNTFVIFTGSFFSENDEENVKLYYEYLKLKTNNLDNFSYLNNLTSDTVTSSCRLLARFNEKVTEFKKVSVFFEPDIVLFKKQHILIQNSRPTAQRLDTSVKLTTVLTKADPKGLYKSFILNPSLNTFDTFSPHDSKKPAKDKYFILNYSSTASPMDLPIQTDILCPKNTKCSDFKAGYQLTKLDDNTKLERATPTEPGIFLITKNTSKMPTLREPDAKLSQEELDYLEGKAPKVEAEPPKVKEEAKVKVKEEVKEEEEEELETVAKAFVEDPAAFDADEMTLDLDARYYEIRIPTEKKVKDDWLRGIFTEDEARLLNSLQLTPSLLSKTFGESKWLERLTEFLESLANTSCFIDTSLLTTMECSNAQEFVKQVYFQLFTQTLNKIYTEFGVPKPKKLGDFTSLLKKSGVNVKSFDKYSFTGDLLNRFHGIRYDPKTGDYSTDFAQIDEATQKLLDRLSFSRIESKNYDELKDKILEILGPSASAKPGSSVSTFSNSESSVSSESSGSSVSSESSESSVSSESSESSVSSESSGSSVSSESSGSSVSSESSGSSVSSESSEASTLRFGLGSEDSSVGTGTTSSNVSPPPMPIASSSVPQYTLDDLDHIYSKDLFKDPVQVKDDGLCFYRAVLKGIYSYLTSNVEGTYYKPNEEDTMKFVRQIKNWLETHGTELKVIDTTASSAATISIPEYFTKKYGPREGDEDRINLGPTNGPIPEEKKERYIPFPGAVYKKMTFQEYLDSLVNTDPIQRPYAELNDAGIGWAAATLKNMVIVILQSISPTEYMVAGPIFSPDTFKTKKFSDYTVLFLEFVSGNHFNLLKLKPTTILPRKTRGGGTDDDETDDEILDLGFPHEGGSTAAPDQRRGSTAAPDQRRGSTAAPDQRRGSTAAPDQRRGSTAAPDQRRGSTAAPDQRRGSDTESILDLGYPKQDTRKRKRSSSHSTRKRSPK